MSYPYIASGGLVQTAFQQFRKSLPAKIDSSTLKKLGLASSNEGPLINILKFVGIIDKENGRTKEGVQLFAIHDDGKFAAALSTMVQSAYAELFALHGEGSWALDRDALISFFRQTDETSSVTGSRQALTFQTLASLSGKRQEQIPSRAAPGPRAQTKEKKPVAKGTTKPAASGPPAPAAPTSSDGSPVGLTVRIEINLPANGSQATYDNIFESIRKNLLNGKA